MTTMTRLTSQLKMPSRTVRRSARGEARVAAVCRDMCGTRNLDLGAMEGGISKTHARLRTTLIDPHEEVGAGVLEVEVEVEEGKALWRGQESRAE
jgi:hypothetical protein